MLSWPVRDFVNLLDADTLTCTERDYPIINNDKRFKSFRPIPPPLSSFTVSAPAKNRQEKMREGRFLGFWTSLMELSRDRLILETQLFDPFVDRIIALSESPFRSYRHTATLVGIVSKCTFFKLYLFYYICIIYPLISISALKLATGYLEAFAFRESQLSNAIKMLQSEQNRRSTSTGNANRSSARLRTLEDNVQQVTFSFRQLLLIFCDSLIAYACKMNGFKIAHLCL